MAAPQESNQPEKVEEKLSEKQEIIMPIPEESNQPKMYRRDFLKTIGIAGIAALGGAIVGSGLYQIFSQTRKEEPTINVYITQQPPTYVINGTTSTTYITITKTETKVETVPKTVTVTETVTERETVTKTYTTTKTVTETITTTPSPSSLDRKLLEMLNRDLKKYRFTVVEINDLEPYGGGYIANVSYNGETTNVYIPQPLSNWETARVKIDLGKVLDIAKANGLKSYAVILGKNIEENKGIISLDPSENRTLYILSEDIRSDKEARELLSNEKTGAIVLNTNYYNGRKDTIYGFIQERGVYIVTGLNSKELETVVSTAAKIAGRPGYSNPGEYEVLPVAFVSKDDITITPNQPYDIIGILNNAKYAVVIPTPYIEAWKFFNDISKRTVN